MHPAIGLGTYNLLGKECTRAVREALEIGYRLFDTASMYENHREIGEAISAFDRDKLFLVSKVWIESEVDDADIKGSMTRACEKALRELATPYLDLYLIHWPVRARPLEQMLEAMHGLKGEGKIAAVGVSNFTEHHLQDAYDAGIEIAWNQIEVHPLLSQERLIDFARRHGTETMAYRPFGKGELLADTPLLAEIGKRTSKTPAQVILRWLLQRGVTAIPKASSREHLKENFEVFDFELTEGEMEQINALNCNHRYCEKEFSEFDY